MDDQSRRFPPETGPEKESLLGFLRHHRDTLRWKCDGLGDEQLRQRSVPTSNLSLLGLVRHLTEVELGWIRKGVEGHPETPYYWCREGNWDADFDDVATASVAEAFAAWDDEAAHTDEVLGALSLDEVFSRTSSGGSQTMSIRWLLTHLVEEYARHNGHADLLREAIDGATGE